MLSSTQILALISAPPSSVQNGKILYLQRNANPQLTSEAERALLDELATRGVPARASYVSPRARSAEFRRGDGRLTPAELVWLGRIPTDPRQVTYADAVALSGLAGAISEMKHPGDARLVESVWAPVRTHHDRLHAKAALDNANLPVPPMPTTALKALTEAIAREVPELSPQEARARAEQALTDARAAVTARAEREKAAALDALAAVEAAAAARTSTVAP